MRLYTAVAFALLFFNARAQNGGNTPFRIIDISVLVQRENPGIKQQLNDELQGAATKKEVFAILNKRIGKYKNLPVRIRQQLGPSIFSYYVYFIGGPKEVQITIVDIKGSRDLSTEGIYRKYQLGTFFADTLVLLDTLKAAIYPLDFNYGINDYFLVAGEGAGRRTIRLSSDGKNRLFLCKGDLDSTAAYPLPCHLYNRADAQNELASFYVRLLDEDCRRELASVSESLMEDYKDEGTFPQGNLIDHLRLYIAKRWGNIPPASVSEWLKRSYKP